MRIATAFIGSLLCLQTGGDVQTVTLAVLHAHTDAIRGIEKDIRILDKRLSRVEGSADIFRPPPEGFSPPARPAQEPDFSDSVFQAMAEAVDRHVQKQSGHFKSTLVAAEAAVEKMTEISETLQRLEQRATAGTSVLSRASDWNRERADLLNRIGLLENKVALLEGKRR